MDFKDSQRIYGAKFSQSAADDIVRCCLRDNGGLMKISKLPTAMCNKLAQATQMRGDETSGLLFGTKMASKQLFMF